MTPDAILGNYRDPKIWRDSNGEIRMRSILDRFSVEAFVNDGEVKINVAEYDLLSEKGHETV